MHGNRSNPGYQYDFIALSKNLQAEVASPVHPMLEGDHAPLMLETRVSKSYLKEYKPSLVG